MKRFFINAKKKLKYQYLRIRIRIRIIKKYIQYINIIYNFL